VLEKSIDSLLKSPTGIPIWWKSREEHIQQFLDNEIIKGNMKLLSTSSGGRPVRAIFYGEAEPHLRGTANYNSAVASGNVDSYYRKSERKRPVFILIAGVHGQEMEGIVATLSLLSLMEKGIDLKGNKRPALLEKLQKLRMIVIPIINPDGRARVPYDGWVDLPSEEMHKYGQGTRKNGELYNYPYNKRVHPMKGDVGILGGYYDDEGVNMSHDEWACPMSETTKALLKLVQEEGPDMIANLHSHESECSILPLSNVPENANIELHRLARMYYRNLECKEYRYKDNGILIPRKKSGLNLNSMLYHVSGAICFTHESTHGCSDTYRPAGIIYEKNPYNYDDILEMHHTLFESIAEYMLG